MSLKEAKRMWDRDAQDWVRQEPLGILAPSVRNYAHAYINNLLSIVPKDRPILDLGTGANTLGYFGQENKNRIVGIDLSQKMLALNDLDMKLVALINDNLPIKSDSISLVTSLLAMRYQTRVEHLQLLDEIARVLVPGGGVLLIDVPLNGYPHQYSSFDAEAVATLLEKLGFENVASNKSYLKESVPDGNGFGGVYTHHTYIGMASGTVPKSGHLKNTAEIDATDYLIKSEDGSQQIREEKRRTHF